MNGFVLQAQDHRQARLHPARYAEFRETVLRQALNRARRHDVDLVAEPARRTSDLVMLWFQGERVRVLRAVGGWDPGPRIELQIAHASQCAGRYELALYAVVRHDSHHRAA